MPLLKLKFYYCAGASCNSNQSIYRTKQIRTVVLEAFLLVQKRPEYQETSYVPVGRNPKKEKASKTKCLFTLLQYKDSLKKKVNK